MRNSLLILRGFAHDPHSILAAIYQSALVGIELCCNISRRQSGVIFAGQENGVAMLTNASHWESRSYDPQLPFWRTASRHSASLRHFGVSSLQPVEIKRHHHRNRSSVAPDKLLCYALQSVARRDKIRNTSSPLAGGFSCLRKLLPGTLMMLVIQSAACQRRASQPCGINKIPALWANLTRLRLARLCEGLSQKVD